MSSLSSASSAPAETRPGAPQNPQPSPIAIFEYPQAGAPGVDVPGVGCVRPGQPVPEPLRSFVCDNDAREVLLAQLLFAARNLANRGMRSYISSASARWCCECHAVSDRNRLRHADACLTGRVLVVVDQILALDNDKSGGIDQGRREIVKLLKDLGYDAAKAWEKPATEAVKKPAKPLAKKAAKKTPAAKGKKK